MLLALTRWRSTGVLACAALAALPPVWADGAVLRPEVPAALFGGLAILLLGGLPLLLGARAPSTWLSRLATMLVSGANAEADLNLRFQAQQEARVALDTFRTEVHNACDATVSGATVTLKRQAGYTCTVTSSTWCVLGTAPRFALYRQPGASCSTAGVKWADYVTSNAVFGVVAGAGLLKKVSVNLPVNRKPSVPRLQYRLQDAIVLRNGARG